MDDLVERLLKRAENYGDFDVAVLLVSAAGRIQALEARIAELQPTGARWSIGAKVRKKRGSSWRGTVVGYYSTPHTPVGYCVDSAFEPGSVQVWPDAALEDWCEVSYSPPIW